MFMFDVFQTKRNTYEVLAMATEVRLLEEHRNEFVTFDLGHVLLFQRTLPHSKAKGVRRDRLFALHIVVAVAETIVDKRTATVAVVRIQSGLR